MDKVRVKKDDLITALKINRDAHEDMFVEAHAAWVEDTISVHKARIKSLKETGKSGAAPAFGTEPVSQVKSYDRAVAMLTMSVDDVIELSEQEFTQYVLDEWMWTSSFKAVTSVYKK